jgi:ABC-type Mn2+/Zn2+ transport system permease subunit
VIFNPQQAQVSALANRVRMAQSKTSMIALAIGFSIGIYMAIGLILLSLSKQTAASSNNEMQFLIAAGLLAFASIAYRRAQFGRLRLEVIATLRGIEGLIKHFVQTTIISVAIAEVIGLLGLLIMFFGGTERDVLILGIVGIALVFSNYPRREAWLKTAQYFESNLYKEETETKSA